MNRPVFAFLGALAGATVPMLTQAQTQALAPEADSASTELADVVVTAQRRSESVQNIGAAVTAADAATLQMLGVKSIDDLVLTTPSLKVSSPFGDGGVPQFSIRGVTIGSFGLNQSRPIALYVDDSIRSLGALEIMPIYDVERVEVLKGPQGSLYGLNAVGGAINVITQKPGFDTSGYLTLGYGNYDRREARGAAQTVLINDVLSVRAAFTGVLANGWVNNLEPGGKNAENTDLFSARLGLRFKPSDRFDSTLTFSRTTSNNDGYSVYPANIGSGYNPVLGTSRAGLGFYDEYRGTPSFGSAGQTSFNLRMDYYLDFAKLSSISSYDTGEWTTRNADCMCQLDAADDIYAIKGIKQYFQELRLQSNSDGRLKWLVGASYERDSADITNQFLLFDDPVYNPYPAGSANNFAYNYGNIGRTQHNNAAAYGRIDFNPIDRVHVFGGTRYQVDKVNFLNYNSYNDFGTINAYGTPVPAVHNLDAATEAVKTSFETGVDVKPLERLLVYLSFKQGFRGPGTNDEIVSSPDEAHTAKPETLDAYEVGFKWDITHELRLNGAWFHYNYKDQQYYGLLPDSFAFGLVNAGSATIIGTEFELKYAPIKAVVLTAAGTFIDPRYKQFVLNGISYAGNQIVLAPKTSVSFGPDITVAQGLGGSFLIHTDIDYQSRMFFDATNDPEVGDPGHWLVNGRASWTADNDHWSAGLWAKNIMQRHYYTYGFNEISFFGFIGDNRGEPRMFGADVTYRF